MMSRANRYCSRAQRLHETIVKWLRFPKRHETRARTEWATEGEAQLPSMAQVSGQPLVASTRGSAGRTWLSHATGEELSRSARFNSSWRMVVASSGPRSPSTCGSGLAPIFFLRGIKICRRLGPTIAGGGAYDGIIDRWRPPIPWFGVSDCQGAQT